MYITKQSDYAVILMTRLAEQYLLDKKQPYSLMQLSREYGISFYFLQRIARSLRRAKLVQGIEGRQGGYRLLKAPDKVTLGDIVRVIEGPVSIMSCAVEGCNDVPEECTRYDACVAKFAWRELQEMVAAYLDQHSLQDLLNRKGEKKKAVVKKPAKK